MPPDLLKPIDPKALKALRAYRPRPWEPPAMGSPEQLLLQAAGYWHTPRRIGHDASLRWLLDERAQAQQDMLATSFLLGVIWERGDLRAALPAYSASLHMPDHAWQGLSAESVSCEVCGQMQQIECDFSFMHLCQWTGSVIAYKPAELAYALQVQRLVLSPQIDTLEAHQLAHVRHLGAQRLLAVLQFLDARPPQETPTVLKRHLAKSGLMRWTQQSASEFIDAMGFLGVLQPPGHKSFLHEHVSHLAPRKSSSSDWSYPVDFWLGRDGVNWEAVRFWFGELGAESGGLNAPPA